MHFILYKKHDFQDSQSSLMVVYGFWAVLVWNGVQWLGSAGGVLALGVLFSKNYFFLAHEDLLKFRD